MRKNFIAITIACLFTVACLGGCRWAGRTAGRFEKGTRRTVHHIERGAHSTADKIEHGFEKMGKSFQKGYEDGKK